MIAENDPAGMGIAFRNALEAHTEHHCRLVTTETRYNFEFEKDLHVPELNEEGFDEVEELLRGADILHFHVLADEHLPLGPLDIRDFIRGKVLLHHHHGHPEFRAHPAAFREKYRELHRKALVSTPDLLRLMPEAAWQPNLVPILSPLYRPLPEGGGDGWVRIAHSPTRSSLKNTREFQRVMGSLKTGQKHVTEVIIRGTLHSVCLRLKRNADIHFDHMQGYFGVSSLEGLSQGKPVIAGLDEWNVHHVLETSGAKGVPWIVARDERALSRALTRLVDDPEERRTAGAYSRRFMESHWSDKLIVEKLTRFYASL